MRYRLGFLCVIVALLATVCFSAEVKTDTIRDLKSGDWVFNFSPNNGVNLSYKGINIIRFSTMDINSGQGSNSMISFSKGPVKVNTRDITGGKEVQIHLNCKAFNGTQTIHLLNNKATFQWDYAMSPDVSNGLMDYCFGYLSGQLLAGRPYTLKCNNTVKTGVFKITGAKIDLNYADRLYQEGTFDTALGKMRVNVSGDLAGLMLLEFRGGPHPFARKAPVLWSGIFNKKMEPGKKYSQTVTLSIDPAPLPKRTVRNPQGKSVEVTPVKEAFTSPGGDLLIIPEPKSLSAQTGYFLINKDTQIVVTDEATEKDLSGAELLTREIAEIYKLNLKTVRESQVTSDKNIIVVGEWTRNRILLKLSARANIIPPNKSEGYALKVTPDYVLIAGADEAGTFYGIQSLRQLVYPDKTGKPQVHACTVEDWPTMKFRSVMLYTGNKALPYHKKLIDQLLTKYKYNTLFIHCDYVQWKTNPLQAVESAMSQEDLKKDIAYARKNHLEVIPSLSTLGHFNWAFKNNQNLDICEDTAIPYAYCASNPKTYDYVFSIMNEAIELFDHPRYFHIGHDEVANSGTFPNCAACKKKGMNQIIIDDTNKINAFLNKQGIQAIMWGDMLIAPEEAAAIANAPDAAQAKKRRAGLAKNIIIADWHYPIAPKEGYRSIALFEKEGFETICCSFRDTRNIADLTREAKRDESLGHMLTIWAGINSNEDNLIKEKDQFVALVPAGDFAWNTGELLGENLPYKPESVFDQTFYMKTPEAVNKDGFTVDLQNLYNVKLADNPKGTGWMGYGPDLDLSSAPTGEIILKGIKFKLSPSTAQPSALRLASSFDVDAIYPGKAVIPINTKAKSLIFLQTTVRNDNLDDRIGAYVMRYADGSKAEVPVIYGQNITAWNDTRACAGANMAWGGVNKAGEHIVLRTLEWTNPSPEKQITSIEMISDKTESGFTLLGLTGTR